MEKDFYINYFRSKYSYASVEDINICYEISLEHLLNCYDPFRTTNEVPEKYQYTLINVMEELMQFGGLTNVTSYNENGFSFSKESGFSSLKSIIPKAGLK